MARKIFFSFHYERDHWRVNQVRKSSVIGNFKKTPFYDKAGWEQVKRQGDAAIKRWIDQEMKGTSVTVVLIGAETAGRRWVKYEIQQSIRLGKGLIGVHISGIKDQHGHVESSLGANPLPGGYKTYLWNKNNGAANLARWVEEALS